MPPTPHSPHPPKKKNYKKKTKEGMVQKHQGGAKNIRNGQTTSKKDQEDKTVQERQGGTKNIKAGPRSLGVAKEPKRWSKNIREDIRILFKLKTFKFDFKLFFNVWARTTLISR